jgi:hypothetical protein
MLGNVPKAAHEIEQIRRRTSHRLRCARLHARLHAMNLSSSLEALRGQLSHAVTPGALGSFDAMLVDLQHGWSLPRLLSAFAATARTLGRAPLPAIAEKTRVSGDAGAVPLLGFTADMAGRAILLLSLAQAEPTQIEEAVFAAYEQGDTLEKLAIVRTLPLLPDAARFLELALDTGRTNDVGLFRALACDNPFPAAHYPELEWNKLFMKAAFVEVPLERIVGLSRRENPELARMALEYIEQQESAGRAFPPGLWLAIAPFPPPGAAAKLLGYATHAVADVRLGATRALARVCQPRTESFLRERLEIERDARVQSALTHALESLHAAQGTSTSTPASAATKGTIES